MASVCFLPITASHGIYSCWYGISLSPYIVTLTKMMLALNTWSIFTERSCFIWFGMVLLPFMIKLNSSWSPTGYKEIPSHMQHGFITDGPSHICHLMPILVIWHSFQHSKIKRNTWYEESWSCRQCVKIFMIDEHNFHWWNFLGESIDRHSTSSTSISAFMLIEVLEEMV